MSPIWVDNDGVLVGTGDVSRLDPGIGPGRYQTALDAVRASGSAQAFASFTFDIHEPNSVVLAPEQTEKLEELPVADPLSDVVVVDDGVDAWTKGFHKAMQSVRAGEVEKVVLARQMIVELPPAVDRMALASLLARANPGCFTFSVDGLIGASPELLVSVSDGRVRSLALAGTATDPEELESVKISEEHRHVSSSVRDVLSRHMTGIELTEQVIVPHGVMSHVGTRIEGPAKPGTTVADILADLHPTAAVAGVPTAAAVDLIRDMEPASRGRYAGPVGWLDEDGQGVFAIALRCGQASGNRMTLFAGGGLVEGSEESGELHETELKLAPMLTALGHPKS
ncbi:MAG: chorismate-binding protein [Acidimicrobiia bacterium]|jgi:menaquinone-specific isochorismate synthase